MKNRELKKHVALLFLTTLVFCSCQEEFPQDDLIEGKWKLESVVNDPNALECEKQAYFEYTKYVYDADERKLLKVNYCDIPEDAEVQEPIVVENYYSIVEDTLVIIDEKRDTKKYVIEHINKETMTLLDKNLNPTNYVRVIE
ncbi:MAG: hypothetical protein J6Q96_07410 [Bacteroidales bacterium]|jgi:hypothetical protein|nr:hypothetical protein [Bacteroidales bacterium]MBQ2376050.1 hypothetical protein [Bacteroidales bacterium]MBQ2397520.1 hypothetical protein [Bacteroidales bacterium]MBQ5892559.1 hypothetical protein [Bacteroidales bacterium]MED9962369.1 hypothetical protein [Bacteroidales bacterium]